MKKFLTEFGIMALILAATPLSASAADLHFPDSEGHANQIAVEYLYDNGVINGYSDGTFKPDLNVNRAELLKILIKGNNVNLSGYDNADTCFPDLEEGAWYVAYVCYAKDQGWVQGYTDGSFQPAQTVNRMEAIKMLIESQSMHASSTPDMLLYADVATDTWYYPYVFSAVELGLVDPAEMIGVLDNMTRGEISEMTYRAMRIESESVVDFYEADIMDIEYLASPQEVDIIGGDYSPNQYIVGTIMTNGPLFGSDLVVFNACDGMCMSPYMIRMAFNQAHGDYVVLTSHSHPDYADVLPSWGITEYEESDVILHSLLTPQIVEIPGTSSYMSLQNADYSEKEWSEGDEIIEKFSGLYQIDGQDISCMRYKKNDFSVAQYEYDTEFFKYDNEVIGDFGLQEVDISLEYGYLSRGCGVHSNCYYLEDSEGLYLAGETSNGLDLFLVEDAVEDPEDAEYAAQEALANYYQSYKRIAEYAEEDYMSFDEVVDAKYLIFFEDPMGNFGALIHDELKPPAECGKPVVYLYPEEKMDVSVEVLLDELTVTIPEHGEDGWDVCAYPDGSIFNYADGQEYPYLFWEGHKDGVIAMDKGSLVARDDLEDFLNESLDAMGFNATEKADFLEFWLVRMLDNPEDNFFVSFIGAQDFNKVAPLDISPEPDTLIRVFMYYHPTNKDFVPEPQELKAFEREGFTVFEWGGTSSSEWKK